jgi:hypothetical protein
MVLVSSLKLRESEADFRRRSMGRWVLETRFFGGSIAATFCVIPARELCDLANS